MVSEVTPAGGDYIDWTCMTQRKSIITEAETLRRIKNAKAIIPPLEMADQHAVLFNYRMSLQVILILLEEIAELKKTITRKEKGNSDLSRMLEDMIIRDGKTKPGRRG
jgi:hypothetical protein